MTNFFQRVLFACCLLPIANSFAQGPQPAQQPPPKPPVKKDSINSYIPRMIDNETVDKIYVGCDNLYHYKGAGNGKISAKLGTQTVPERNGFFIIHVAQTGKYSLSIFEDMTHGNPASNAPVKLIAEKIFDAVELPDPSAAVAGKSCGFITKKELQASDSIIVKTKKQGAGRVLSFKMTLVTGKAGRTEFESKSNRLTPEMKSALINTPEGTVVLFEYVRALIRLKGAGVSISLPSVSFILEK
jgi:hypothetical protein